MKFSIIIRFTHTLLAAPQLADLEIPLSVDFNKDDINRLVNTPWLKLIIRNKLKACHKKRLRLIFNGRVLNQTTDFKKDIFEPRRRQLALDENDKEPYKVYIHCVVGEDLSADELREENALDNEPQRVSTTPQVAGFDRLLQQGFLQEDIDDLRRQFHQIYMPGVFESGAADAISDMEEVERRQQLVTQLEERWIESTINSNENGPRSVPVEPERTDPTAAPAAAPAPDLDDSRGNVDLLLGLLVGIFLGVVSLVFLAADDSVFSKKQTRAIVGGVFINFMFAMARGQWI